VQGTTNQRILELQEYDHRNTDKEEYPWH
jgi:hypothetical protein